MNTFPETTRNFLLNTYVPVHNKDIPKAKFKIGQEVMMNGNRHIRGKILAVNDTGLSDGIEYFTDFHSSLLWEVELKEFIK